MLLEIRRWVAIAIGVALVLMGLAIGGWVGAAVTDHQWSKALEQCKADKTALEQARERDLVASAALAGKAAEIAWQMGRDSIQPAVIYRDRVKTIETKIPPIVKEIVRHVPTDCPVLPAAVRVLHDRTIAIANGEASASPDTGDGAVGLGSADPVEVASFVETAVENAGIAGQNAAKVIVLQAKLRLAVDAINRYNDALEGQNANTPR